MTSYQNIEAFDATNSSNQSSLLWKYIINQYHEKDIISFKLLDLYKAFPLLTEARVQILCQELESQGFLILSSGRSRIITYEITESHRTPKAVNPKPVELVDVEVPDTHKAIKSRSLSNISTIKPKKMKAIVEKDDGDDHKGSLKTPSSKAKEDTSPSSIVFVNQATTSPPASIMDKICALIQSSCPNPASDIVHMSTIRAKCIELAITEELMKECLRALMDENKIMIDNEDIYIF